MDKTTPQINLLATCLKDDIVLYLVCSRRVEETTSTSCHDVTIEHYSSAEEECFAYNCYLVTNAETKISNNFVVGQLASAAIPIPHHVISITVYAE